MNPLPGLNYRLLTANSKKTAMRSLLLTTTLVFAFCFAGKANDSTLFKARMQQIKSFSNWLASKSNNSFSFSEKDTLTPAWKLYDTAITLYFDRPAMDALFAGETNVFDVSAKYHLLKYMISGFDALCDKVPADSLQLEKTIPYDSVSDTYKDPSGLHNMISQYIIVAGGKYTIFSFLFAESSTRLLSLIESGVPVEVSSKIRSYINGLPSRNTGNRTPVKED
jgi:hypothetical protein